MSCAKSELCIFDSPSPQIVVENGSFEEIFPVNSITGNANTDVEFNIVASHTDYLDLNDTLLSIQVQVLKKANKKVSDLTAEDIVTPANYFFHTLFKDAVLTLNNVRIEGGNNSYAHKALIETIINYSSDTMKTNLSSIGYAKTDEERQEWIKESAVFSMCGSLQLDFFDQPKYLLPGVSVHLRLVRNETKFCLSSAVVDDCIIKISDAKLYVRRVKVEPSVLIAHKIGLAKSNAKYPIRKTQLVSYTISAGSMSLFKDQIFGDFRLPKFILITFQDHSQYVGSLLHSSSTYKHFDVNSITVSRNNDFRETYYQDFTRDNYVTSYVTSMIRNMGHLDKNLNNGISKTEFKNTYPFFTFVLAPDFDAHQSQVAQQGNLRLDIKFSAPLAGATNVIIYGIFDSEIQINNNGTIFL